MILSPEKFAEMVGIDSYLHPFLHARRVVRVCLFMGFIFPNLLLRLYPVLICMTVLAASLFIEFIGALGDLRGHIGRFLGQKGRSSWIEHSIRKQFHPIIHEEPDQRIAPHERSPAPA